MDCIPRRRGPILVASILVMLTACSTLPRAPETGVSQAQAPAEPQARTPAEVIAAAAAKLVGTPYRFGGSDSRGFDCSGLAAYVYEQAGITIPRTAAEQQQSARSVSPDELKPGDLVFFRIHSRHIDHVGVYVGDGRFVHAPKSGAVVSYATLAQGYYQGHLVSIGRFW